MNVSHLPPVLPAGQAIRTAAAMLRRAGIGDSAPLEARLLVAYALGVSRESLLGHPERALPSSAADRLAGLLRRRASREPLSHLLGVREFWSLPFQVTPATLDPRPDSETLIRAALDRVANREAPLRILDLGTGSGCLLLSLLSELPNATGLGVDLQEAALAIARRNAEALGYDDRARFLVSDWGRGIDARFDLILSNPPYIPDADIDCLQPEIARYESRIALQGGADGLVRYREMAPHLRRLLCPEGAVFLEIGDGQAAAVVRILAEHGFEVRRLCKDLAGLPRCIVAQFQR
ncbi:MAG: peptide chain release factor N(5)-glutamine methyltransferase [Pseudomonadota bacterium]